MIAIKQSLLITTGVCVALLSACGTDNDGSNLADAGKGSCTIVAVSGDQYQQSCTQYVDQSPSFLSAAIANCTGSQEQGSDVNDIAVSWSLDLCSDEGEVGRCEFSNGETIYSGSGYSASILQASCDKAVGTFTSAQ